MDFWGTMIMSTGLLIGFLYFILKVFALMEGKDVKDILGFNDQQTDRALNTIALGLVLFFVFLGYFVKGRAYEVSVTPDATQLGTTKLNNKAPASLTPTQIEKDSIQKRKEEFPELSKTPEQRDEEVNDYVQKAIERAKSQ